MSLIGDHANINIVHNIYKAQSNSDKLHDYLNMYCILYLGYKK